MLQLRRVERLQTRGLRASVDLCPLSRLRNEMTPRTKYARSGDVAIAYQVWGRGPVDLVWAPGTASHLDLEWEMPLRALFFEKLGAFCRVIKFDKRGTGLSDRPIRMATLEERSDDIRAVMDAEKVAVSYTHLTLPTILRV